MANSLAAAGLRSILRDQLEFGEVLVAGSIFEIESCLLQAPTASLLVLDSETARNAIPDRLLSLRETYPDLRIAILADRLAREDILAALSSGVHGYAGVRQPLAEIVDALRDVAQGRISVAAEVAAVPAAQPAIPRAAYFPKVSLRQHDVLRLLAEGNSNKDIARTLRLSEGTVKAHIAAAYRKLRVHNRTQAVAALSRLADQ